MSEDTVLSEEERLRIAEVLREKAGLDVAVDEVQGYEVALLEAIGEAHDDVDRRAPLARGELAALGRIAATWNLIEASIKTLTCHLLGVADPFLVDLLSANMRMDVALKMAREILRQRFPESVESFGVLHDGVKHVEQKRHEVVHNFWRRSSDTLHWVPGPSKRGQRGDPEPIDAGDLHNMTTIAALLLRRLDGFHRDLFPDHDTARREPEEPDGSQP